MSRFADIRSDFPLLQQHPNLIYFDNACMSLRPQVVIDAITRYYTDLSACAGRSNHRLASKVTQAVDDSRRQIQKFINADKAEEIIFVRNTSEGLNLIANTLQLNKQDVVLTSDKEHNSNLVPWLKLHEVKGIQHKAIPSHPDNQFYLEAFTQLLDESVKLVSIVHTSNLDGVTYPLKQIIQLAHDAGALVMVDAAQSAPHLPLDVKDLDVDFLTFSGHKMMGPSGMGVLYGKYHLLEQLSGFMVGGDTVVSTTYNSYELLPPPEKFEAGLQNYAGIMGFGAAAKYLMQLDLDAVHQHETALNTQATELLSDIPDLHIIGPADPGQRGGVVSFHIPDKDPHQIALMLDETAGVMVRSGQHCVHSWFHAQELPGSVRASFYAYNTHEEVERFSQALHSVMEII